MLSLKVQNKYQETLELTNNPAYDLTNIDGIDPPDAIINTTHNAGVDGSVFNSAYMDERTITITMALNYPVEQNRLQLYRYLKTKEPVRVFVSTEYRDVYIDGYVQSIQVGYFNKKQAVQVVIFCPQPHFNGIEVKIQPFMSLQAGFEFAFDIEESGIPFSEIILDMEKSIINSGDMETGVLIRIQAFGSVTNPKIYNVGTVAQMTLNIEMEEGDEIIINTRQGEKSINLVSGGITRSIIGKLGQGDTWFSMAPGDNLFTVTADENPENMQITFECIDQYEGV